MSRNPYAGVEHGAPGTIGWRIHYFDEVGSTQKVAAEMPQISREIQAAGRAEGAKAAKEAFEALREQNPEMSQSARRGFRARRWQSGGRGLQAPSQQAAQQPNPQ